MYEYDTRGDFLSKRLVVSKERKEELYKEIVPIANEFRKKNEIGNAPIQDTFETLEGLGFFILRFPAHDDLSGFHINKSGVNCIFINSSHNLARQYFSAWHECYHAITGQAGGISLLGDEKYSEMELCADIFAGCVMMPEGLIKKYIRRNRLGNLKYIKHTELIKMQNYFKVSYAALIRRLKQIYPEHTETLDQRAILGYKPNTDKMLEKILEADESDILVKPTNDFYVSDRLYKSLHSNLEKDRITVEKVESVINFIESVKEHYER